MPKVSFRDLPLTEILNNCNGLDYFLSKISSEIEFFKLIFRVFEEFLQSIDANGYGNFYLNAEVNEDFELKKTKQNNWFCLQAFRCAGQSASINKANTTLEQQKINQDILRRMANDLIEQYFLPTVGFSSPFESMIILQNSLGNI